MVSSFFFSFFVFFFLFISLLHPRCKCGTSSSSTSESFLPLFPHLLDCHCLSIFLFHFMFAHFPFAYLLVRFSPHLQNFSWGMSKENLMKEEEEEERSLSSRDSTPPYFFGSSGFFRWKKESSFFFFGELNPRNLRSSFIPSFSSVFLRFPDLHLLLLWGFLLASCFF